MRRVDLNWQGGRLFEAANEEDARLKMDVLKSKGGSGEGMTPVETMLASVAGCSGIDLVNILTKMRVKLESLRIEADSTQAPDHPMYFDYIRLTYYIKGEGVTEKKVQKAIGLSMQKYCSVKASMADKCRFETVIVIE